MASKETALPPAQPDSPTDLLGVLASGITKMAANEAEPKRKRRKAQAEPAPSRELLTEKMLAERWVCSVSRLQRWRSEGEGPPYLKIVGKVLYRLKDIEAYEDSSLIRSVVPRG